MDIWVKDCNGCLVNLSHVAVLRTNGNDVKYVSFVAARALVMGTYKSNERAEHVLKGIQDHINAIGTNNFNNLPMVYVMPIE